MIDLEQHLATLVERAPEPPAIDAVRRRVRRRRRNRLVTRIASTLLVVAIAAVSYTATRPSSRPHVATTTPANESVTVPLLGGSGFTITGSGLGLTALPVSFHAAMTTAPASASYTEPCCAVALDARRTTLEAATAGMARDGTYSTADGAAMFGLRDKVGDLELFAQYGDWVLVVSGAAVQHAAPAQATTIAGEVHASVTADGWIRVTPAAPWILGPIDAPDIEFGDGAIGIFMSEIGCPRANEINTHTPGGLGVQDNPESGAWWCDPASNTRISVGDRALIPNAVRTLRVERVQPVRVTSLYSETFDLQAPDVHLLDNPRFDATVQVGIGFAATISATHDALPPASGPAYRSSDGFPLVTAQNGLGQPVLAGDVGGWSVLVAVDGLDVGERAQLVSLLRFREIDGFLIVEPVAPLHLVPSNGTDIVFDSIRIDSSLYPKSCSASANATPGTHDVRCDPLARIAIDARSPIRADQVQVSRVRP